MSLDIATVYNRYGFIGSEYLLWLWWASEVSGENMTGDKSKDEVILLELRGGIIIENNKPEKPKLKITIKSQDAGKKEAAIAISEGGRIKEIVFNLRISEEEFSFIITADDLAIKGLKTPSVSLSEEPDEIEGAVLEKIYLCKVVFEFLDLSYKRFLTIRTAEKWSKITMPKIVEWLSDTMGSPGGITFQQELFNADGTAAVDQIPDDIDDALMQDENLETERA